MGGWSSFRDKYVKPAVGMLVGGPVGALAMTEKGQEEIGRATSSIGGFVDDVTGKTGIEASKEAAEKMRIAQMDELSYLKEINKLPQQYKEEALTKLRNLSTPEGQQGMIDQAKASPFYKEMLAGREAGEEGVARASSVTGGLRSGNVNEALYDYNTQLENRALTQGYQQQVSGLEGLAGIRTNEQGIANTMGDMSTNAMNARMAQAGMKQQGTANILNTVLGIGGMIL